MSNASALSRRKFLKATGLVTGTAALGAASLALAADPPPTSPPAPPPAAEIAPQTQAHAVAMKIPRGRMFFTDSLDFATLSDAAERIFPKDETGPGAKDLAAPYFIDNQLAGGYGANAGEYTAGPFLPGAPTQGYQTPVLKRDIFLHGVKALNTEARTAFQKDFPRCSDTEKDKILALCATGKIATEGFSSAYFFDLLKNAVLAGCYADPIYMGNDGMNGWKMKQYPGAQMEYAAAIASDKFEVIAPLSLADMQ